MKASKENHLPLYGVGPIIVFGQLIFTALAIVLSYNLHWSCIRINILKIPFKGIGVVLILFGLYLDISAKYKSKLFKKVEENKLITDGVYAYVRNPVYGGMFLVCTGAVFFVNNLVLFIVPVICWIYMSVFLINTEEKWLAERYGQEYVEYCKRVNRCIPWFSKK